MQTREVQKTTRVGVWQVHLYCYVFEKTGAILTLSARGTGGITNDAHGAHGVSLTGREMSTANYE